MVLYGLVEILKLNSRPLINESMNYKGGYRAARAAKNLKFHRYSKIYSKIVKFGQDSRGYLWVQGGYLGV